MPDASFKYKIRRILDEDVLPLDLRLELQEGLRSEHLIEVAPVFPAQMTTDGELLNTAEAAKRFGLSPNHARLLAGRAFEEGRSGPRKVGRDWIGTVAAWTAALNPPKTSKYGRPPKPRAIESEDGPTEQS